jgi:hypothetical protein
MLVTDLYLYSVKYRRRPISSRTYHRTVVASSADEARAEVARLDPEFTATVRSPKRRGPWRPPVTA